MKYIYPVQRVMPFLADRTNGRAIAIHCCVCRRRRLSVTLCIVAKRCVLEQKLLWRAYTKYRLSIEVYEKSIGTKINDLNLCLEVVSRSC